MTEALDSVIRVSAILSLGLVVSVMLRGQSAALRHWTVATTVACALAMPVMAGIVPGWHTGIHWPSSAAQPPAARPRAVAAANDSPAATSPAARLDTPEVTDVPATRRRTGFVPLVLTVWGLGSAATGLVLLVGLMRLRWLASRAHDAEDPAWTRIAGRLRQRYGIRGGVRLLQSDHPALLATWGWRTSTILLPAGAEEWNAERIHVVLAHELAHVARGDWAAQLAAEALRTLYWFNPLVWIACRRLRVESECACDDTVLAQGLDAPDYAAHLLSLARSLQSTRHPSLPAPAMARPSSLEGRVRAMLNDTRNRRPVSSPVRATIAAALLALAIAVAGVQAQGPLYAVSGVATDPSGRVLPNVRVVLTTATGDARFEVRTAASGRYEFAGVPATQYTLEASVPGFEPRKETITVSGVTTYDLPLRVGTLQETITVTGTPAAPPVDDAAALARREEARRRFAESTARTTARCAGGVAADAVGGNILAPRKLVDVRPAYPEHLKASGIGGTVTMTAVVATDGTVRDVENLQGPHPDLAAAAADAVRQWQFSTTLLNCDPIEVRMTVTTNFVTP